MSYTLQAFLIPEGAAQGLASILSKPVRLPQGFVLFPLKEPLRDRYSIPYLPFTDEEREIPQGLNQVGRLLSEKNRAAYVEAEYFGGNGMQASIVWRAQQIEQPLIVTRDAINRALEILGVEVAQAHDRFDALDLGRFRDTDKWE